MAMAVKEYDEPEPDYPLDDSSADSMGPSSFQDALELRIFDSTDLPQHRGDFRAATPYANMVRSKQLAEVVDLMDGSKANQPTLKRFARYNQSMYSRPSSSSSSNCIAEPSSSSSQFSSQSQTYSKGGKLKTGLFSGNWTLRDKKEMRPSVHNITVVPIGRKGISSNTNSGGGSNLNNHYTNQQQHQDSNCNSPQSSRSSASKNEEDSKLLRMSEHISPIRRRDSLNSYSRRRSSASQNNADYMNGGTISSAVSNGSSGDDHVHLHRKANTNGSMNSWTMNGSGNGNGNSQATIARERLIPIEIKNDTSNNNMANRHPNDLQKVVRSREIPVKIHGGRYSEPAIVYNRFRPSCFSMAMLPYSEGNSKDLANECDDRERLDNRRTRNEMIDEDVNDDSNRNSDQFDGDDDEDDQFRSIVDDSQPCRLRRIGGVKSVGPTRRHWHRPVLEVFPYAHTRSISKDSGIPATPSEQRHSTYSFSNDRPSSPTTSPLTEAFTTHLVIDADSAYRTGTSDSSPSSVCSNSESPAMRKSCPDLRNTSQIQPKNLVAHRVHHNQRNRRAREKRQAAEWMKKAVHEWSFDDVLLWLQHCKLDSVASIMIGYDISGVDVDKWDDETLLQLGIFDENMRNQVLKSLANAKRAYEERVDQKNDDASRGRSRMPLFKMVRSASYDKVLALETPLTTRDITVAEGRFGCLQVTKVNGANIPLREHDCFLEINEKPGQLFRSPLMFTKLVSEAAGEPIRLVVLRKEAGDEDDDNSNSGCTGNISNFLQTNPSNTEQDSSASSGVSSSEVPSETLIPTSVPVEQNEQILRL